MTNNPYIKKNIWLTNKEVTLRSLLMPLWNSMDYKINSMMLDGTETCPHAAYAVASELEKLGLSAVIMGGEFDYSSHYWVETIWNGTKYVVDFGNNILAGESDNNLLIPLIVKKGTAFYERYAVRDETYYSSKSFYKAFGSLVKFRKFVVK